MFEIRFDAVVNERKSWFWYIIPVVAVLVGEVDCFEFLVWSILLFVVRKQADDLTKVVYKLPFKSFPA